jgi:type III pantothenate kinase
MYLIGDIGNSEIKICLINQKNIIIKRINFSNSNSSLKDLNKNLKKLKNYFPKIEKILFCSVVPNSFKLIKKFLKTKTKIKCFEIKQLNLSKIIKIKVNYNQVGSDRITNAISSMDDKKNFVIIDLGTATTFDVIIRNSYNPFY